jgi:hypothetical protein
VSFDRSPHVELLLGAGWRKRRHLHRALTVRLPQPLADAVTERCLKLQRGSATPPAAISSVLLDLIACGLIQVGAMSPVEPGPKLRKNCLEKKVVTPTPFKTY